MIRRLLSGFVVLVSMLLESCYPVDESPPYRPGRRVETNNPPVVHHEQVMNETRQEPPSTTGAQPRPQPKAAQPETPQPAAAPLRKPPPPVPARDVAPEAPGRNSPVAQKAPGRDGFVLSPYTSKLVFVRGIPSGTVVPDQTGPPSPQKFFVVP